MESTASTLVLRRLSSGIWTLIRTTIFLEWQLSRRSHSCWLQKTHYEKEKTEFLMQNLRHFSQPPDVRDRLTKGMQDIHLYFPSPLPSTLLNIGSPDPSEGSRCSRTGGLWKRFQCTWQHSWAFLISIFFLLILRYTDGSWAPMAHACNPSYSGGRDQEDCGLKPAWANSLWDPISKNPSQKGLAKWLKVKALSSNPSTEKKKKRYTNGYI
jgi:hypothetical protein